LEERKQTQAASCPSRSAPAAASAGGGAGQVDASYEKWREALQGVSMSNVRVLVGARRGAFILTSDGKRERWNVSGPHFAGWEIYHLKGSPADPNRLYASQSSGWFGQIIQRSDDGGKTWVQPGTLPGEPTTTPDG